MLIYSHVNCAFSPIYALSRTHLRGLKTASEVPFVEYDHVVQALAANRTNDPLHIWILPRTPGCGEDFLDVKTADSLPEVRAIHFIAVTQQIPRRRIPWKSFYDLLSYPLGDRMLSHVEVDHLAPMMRENNQDKQYLEFHRGHCEEIDGHQILEVVIDKRFLLG